MVTIDWCIMTLPLCVLLGLVLQHFVSLESGRFLTLSTLGGGG